MSVDKVGQKAVDAHVQKPQAASDRAHLIAAREVRKTGCDEVSISKGARELREAQKAVNDAPDVRQAEVAAIKKRIQEGTYTFPIEALVDKLLSLLNGG